MDIVLDVSENSHGNAYGMKFTVKLQPTNMEFVNPSRLKFSADFQNTEELSRSGLQE